LLQAASSASATAVADKPPWKTIAIDPAIPQVMRSAARTLYEGSPVPVFIPTLLPRPMAGQFRSSAKIETGNGYLLSTVLSGQDGGSGVSLLYTMKAGDEPSVTGINAGATQEGGALNGWSLYASGFSASDKILGQIRAKFVAIAKSQPVLANAAGEVTASKAGSTIMLSSRWTYDKITYYSFESRVLSYDDFFAALQSVRPVEDVLKTADMYYLPAKRTLDLKIGSLQMQYRETNRTIKLSSLPTLFKGSVYLPLRDIASILNMEVNYEQKTGIVHLLAHSDGQTSMDLNLRTGKVSQANQADTSVKLLVRSGRTLVPIRFFSERMNSAVEYRPMDKSITIASTYFETGNRISQSADKPDLQLNVFSIVGPAFMFANQTFDETDWSYTNNKPPVGYGPLKYVNYQIGFQLLPGDNTLKFSDMQTKKTIATAVVKADLPPDSIPFRFSGSPFYDGLKIELQLTTVDADGKEIVWPAGYAESSDYVDIKGALSFAQYSSLRMTMQKDDQTSEPVSIPVKNGEFQTRIKPLYGPGTYKVTLNNPPNTLAIPEQGDAMAGIVSFIVIFN
jgi:hypothetical protein